MPTLTELLRDATGELSAPAPFDELERHARRRRTRRHRRLAGVAAVTCLSVVVAGVAIRTRSTSHQRVATASSSSFPPSSNATSSSTAPSTPSSLFSSSTGDVLIFDNGYDGITLLDVDHRVATRRLGVGQRAGDQPYRIARVGTDVLVGWGDISAVPITGGPSRALPPATVFVPAVEPDRVWLVDYPDEAGTPPHAKLVEVSTGTMLADVASPFVGGASFGTGVPGGFAMATEHGIDLWSLASRKVVAHLGAASGGQGQTFDAVGSMLAWCEASDRSNPNGHCDTVHLTDLAAPGGPTDAFMAQFGGQQITSARISPDGTRLAVAMAPDDGSNPLKGPGSVTIVGPQLHRPIGPLPAYVDLGWSSDSNRVYISSGSYEKTTGSLDVWSAVTDTVEHADLPFGGLLQFVTATEAEVGPFPSQTGTQADCPAVDPFTESTPTECTFGF